MSVLRAKNYHNDLIEAGEYVDFTILTSTGISSDFESVFKFAEAYHIAKTKANEANKQPDTKALRLQNVVGNYNNYYYNQLSKLRKDIISDLKAIDKQMKEIDIAIGRSTAGGGSYKP